MLIVGTGAVATFLASKLCKAEKLQFFGAASDRLRGLGERFDCSAVSEVHELSNHELWVVSTKTWQNPEKIEALQFAPRPSALLVLQNGLAPELAWASALQVLVERGLSTYGVRVSSPGQFEGGNQGEVILKKDSHFSESFEKAGFSVQEVASMRSAIWHKLAINASLNVVASLFGLSNGETLHSDRSRRLVELSAAEVCRVAKALGVDWGSRSAWDMVSAVAESTRDNICSTLADLRSGRPTEYDAINGEVLRLARQFSISTPTLSQLDRDFQALLGEGVNRLPTFRARLPLLDLSRLEKRDLSAGALTE